MRRLNQGARPIDFLHASVTGLVQVFAWPTFGLMLIGMLLGFVVGLLPGLGGPTTLALMLPFVFKMNAVEAFAFLLGMTAVTATTGDITSVLFGVPGEPTTEEPSAVRSDVHSEYDADAEGDEVADAERTEPMDPEASARVRGVLEKLAKGEIGIDDAASALDEARRFAPGGPSPLGR